MNTNKLALLTVDFGKKHGISSSTEALQRGTGEGHKAGPEVEKALVYFTVTLCKDLAFINHSLDAIQTQQ